MSNMKDTPRIETYMYAIVFPCCTVKRTFSLSGAPPKTSSLPTYTR